MWGWVLVAEAVPVQGKALVHIHAVKLHLPSARQLKHRLPQTLPAPLRALGVCPDGLQSIQNLMPSSTGNFGLHVSTYKYAVMAAINRYANLGRSSKICYTSLDLPIFR